jgi:hypothetical protein
MKKTARFPQRTTSPLARRLHALLRSCPGYQEVCISECHVSRAQWVIRSVLLLARSDLPIGLKDAARELQAVYLPSTLTGVLSIDQLCKFLVEIGRYCAYRNVVEEEFSHEQARKRG